MREVARVTKVFGRRAAADPGGGVRGGAAAADQGSAGATGRAGGRAGVKTCRVCGCTEEKRTGLPCFWVEPDLCSACAETEEGNWIRFVPAPGKPKTRVWWVATQNGSGCLGKVEWCGPWRKYVLAPHGGTVWEERCLRDVAAFCERKTQGRRA